MLARCLFFELLYFKLFNLIRSVFLFVCLFVLVGLFCLNLYFSYPTCITGRSNKPINWTTFSNLYASSSSSSSLSSNGDYEKLFYSLSHQAKDMVLICQWQGVENCDANNFTTTVTDWGVCYTFNNPENKSEILKSNQPGTQNGLFLRLNVEQYEYVNGERFAAGFKVKVHSHTVLKLVI